VSVDELLAYAFELELDSLIEGKAYADLLLCLFDRHAKLTSLIIVASSVSYLLGGCRCLRVHANLVFPMT
jgi:hypothetical protein